jgi:predicted dehydrogenase
VTRAVRIAVAGVGLIGRRHVDAICLAPGVSLASVVDPSDAAQDFARARGAPWYPSLAQMFAASEVDGVVLATPNQIHLQGALECISEGCPVLVEKPLCVTVDEAQDLVTSAKAAKVAVLTGHHRRHNRVIQKARSLIEEGVLGTIVSVQGTCWFFKPDRYFDVQWRSKTGAGPVFLNLIHDIDLMRYLCGEVASVHALESNLVRGYDVEDTAAVVLRFQSGALGTISVSDTAVSPWSWELTARENPAYPATSEACYQIAGTRGALSLPNLTLWRNDGPRSWWNPISGTKIPFASEDPLIAQIRQFAAVIRGTEAPLVSGEDGLAILRVVEAVKRSARTATTVTLATGATG